MKCLGKYVPLVVATRSIHPAEEIMVSFLNCKFTLADKVFLDDGVNDERANSY
jgi:hypothetical protein